MTTVDHQPHSRDVSPAESHPAPLPRTANRAVNNLARVPRWASNKGPEGAASPGPRLDAPPHTASALAWTTHDRTTFHPRISGHPREREVRAHEAVHQAQFAQEGDTPRGTRAELEAEARAGAQAALDSREFAPRLAAAPWLVLGDSGPEPGQSATPQNSAAAQRPNIGSPPIAEWYSSADPLAPYAVFKQASPAGYAALDSTAKRYTVQPTAETSEPGPGAGWRTQTEVTVADLVRPALPPIGVLGPLRTRLWPLLTTDQDPTAAAAVLRDEVLSLWAFRNAELLNSQATVRLMLPDEAPLAPFVGTPDAGITGFGQQDVLEFSIAGRRIPTSDGSMDPVTLDLFGSNDIETSVAEVAAEASIIAQAADLLNATTNLIEVEGPYWDDVAAEPDKFALNDVTQHLSLLELTIVMDARNPPTRALSGPWPWLIQEFISQHPQYADTFAGPLGTLSGLTDRAAPVANAFFERHDSLSQPDVELAEMKPDITAAKERAGKEWDEGSRFVAVCEYMGWGLGKLIWGSANLATGDYYESRYEGLTAYRQGAISKDQLDELEKAATGRAIASLTVFAALSLLTAGLGGAVLGTGASLGAKMLVSGASAALTTAGTMTTTSVYTRQQDFADPTLQSIWRQGAYSPGDIAIGSLTAGALGAAVPVAGLALSKFVGWLRAASPAPEVALALQRAGTITPEVPPPAGWTGEEVSDGIFRLTHPDVPGEIILTRSGFRYQTPTGTGGMRVEFDLPLSPEMAGSKALAAGPPALPAGPSPGPLFEPGDIEAAMSGESQAEALGPLVSAPPGAQVLDIGTGPAPADLGLGGESVVQIIRTDVVQTFSIDRVLNAEGVLAADLAGSAQAVIINNPYEYTPNLAELGRAVRPGGKIIIQGNLKANKWFRALVKQGVPKGFVLSPEEGFDAAKSPSVATAADPDARAAIIRRNILGGPFRYTRREGGGPRPDVRVVYEKPIEGPDALGKRLGAESRGKLSRFDYVAGGINALQLGQRNAVQAASAAVEEMGLRLWQTNAGDDVVLASVVPGRGRAVLVVKPDGTVLRGQADISIRTPADPAHPLGLSNIVENPPILPGR